VPAPALDGAIEPILAHELTHIRRGDVVFGVLQLLSQLLWWFHPLVWWANRELCREAERCCDEEVVAGLGCRPADYARCLLSVLELKQRLRPVFTFPGMRPVEVTAKRLEYIMKGATRFHRRTPRWCWGVLAASAAMALPGRGLIGGADATASARSQGQLLADDPDPVSRGKPQSLSR
jgi:beta-lactamase regulating signal transducer with metallopeptidase domain